MKWIDTLEERQELSRKRHKPYSMGAKPFLASMEVGEIKVADETLLWDTLRMTANLMRRTYGVLFLLHKEERIIVRVK